jgi:hypothetical protein
MGNANCAIYLPSIEPAEMAIALEYSYESKNKLSSWGQSGRRIVLENYTWGKVARDFEEYLVTLKS